MVWRKRGMLVATAFVLVACERVGSGFSAAGPAPSPSPSLSPSASPTASSAACTALPTATIIVGISAQFGVAQTASGQVAGYADVTTAQPAQAGVIPARVGDTVQFENLASDGVTARSAVALNVGSSSGGFPATPYVFPATAATPSANSAIGTAFWSTGLIAASTSGTACLSQTFTLPASGTYYFGDLTSYNTITSFRDVIVVQ